MSFMPSSLASGVPQMNDRLADLVVFRIADRGLEEVLLAEGDHHGVTDLGVVERLVRRVEAEGVLVAERIGSRPA